MHDLRTKAETDFGPIFHDYDSEGSLDFNSDDDLSNDEQVGFSYLGTWPRKMERSTDLTM